MMQPTHPDVCRHDRLRDRFLGVVEDGQGKMDVYVYQDNALSASSPDMHVCIRYGADGPQYLSPGNADAFVRRVRAEASFDWPKHYLLAVQLVEDWIRGGRQ